MPSRRSICLFLPLACLLAFGSCARHARRGPAATTTATTAAATSEPVTSAPSPPAFAQLLVDVTNLRNRRGQLLVAVYDRAAGFPSDSARAVMSQTRAIDPRSAGLIRLGFPLPPGHYAVAVVHDENRNGKLDAGLLGVPSEGFGVSNNPKMRFGPAKFDAARFELPAQGTVVTVGIQYF